MDLEHFISIFFSYAKEVKYMLYNADLYKKLNLKIVIFFYFYSNFEKSLVYATNHLFFHLHMFHIPTLYDLLKYMMRFLIF